MSAHTPGPWTARLYQHVLDGPRWYVGAVGGGGSNPSPANLRTVATLERVPGRKCNCSSGYDVTGPQMCSAHAEVAANARLIAAAPALLAALKGCLGYFEDMKNAGVNAAHCMPDEAWLAPIRAILRDVEGESHG